MLEADASGPAGVVSRRASDRLRAGHLWVYRSDVESLIPALGATEPPAGGLLTLMDSRRIPLGTGLYRAASQLAAARARRWGCARSPRSLASGVGSISKTLRCACARRWRCVLPCLPLAIQMRRD